MNDHVFIIGAGAIGKALAVFLQSNHRKVTLLRGSVTNGTRYREKIKVLLGQQELEADIEIDSLSNFPELNGIIVLTNKSFGNENIARSLKDKTGDSPLILLQNGLGVEQAFTDLGFPEIYRCVLFVTSQIMENGQVRFKPVSACPVGVVKGNGVQLKPVVEQLSTTHFNFTMQSQIQPVIWKKAIINSVFNSICPLLDIDNGVFHRDAAALEIAQGIIDECLLIAGAKGIILSKNEVLESLLSISRFSDGQPISTLQDIRLGRKTEIDTLNFAVVAEARSLDMEHLVTETKLLGEMTKLKANLNLKDNQRQQ